MSNERKEITKRVEYNIDFEYKTLDQALELLTEYKEAYGGEASFRYNHDVDDHYYEIDLYVKRPETDEEMDNRLKQEEHSRKRHEQFERGLFKYGKEGV